MKPTTHKKRMGIWYKINTMVMILVVIVFFFSVYMLYRNEVVYDIRSDALDRALDKNIAFCSPSQFNYFDRVDIAMSYDEMLYNHMFTPKDKLRHRFFEQVGVLDMGHDDTCFNAIGMHTIIEITAYSGNETINDTLSPHNVTVWRPE